jgi:acetyl-CoA carboxylase biotin carboxylase subunit
MTPPPGRDFSKVLVANRGEIAIRVCRALRELGIASVGIASEADRDALHAAYADECHSLGGRLPSESYLDIEKILAICVDAGVDAVHPGYGFLAENADFADACRQRGIVFIGPPAEAIRAMGSKVEARAIMLAAGVPVVPGSDGYVESLDEARSVAAAVGFPIAVKAAAGGGGMGFRVAETDEQLPDALAAAAREGEKFFGDGRVYIERYLGERRHVEVQVLGDEHGNVIHLGERDCSTQRRHQKIIEEAPAPGLSVERREEICALAVRAARAVGYVSAGTVEGLLSGGEFYFLEMNTRLQVEHAVTEELTGVDIVKEQLAVAMGRPLSVRQQDVAIRGAAIECRVNAERAERGFLPSCGTITRYRPPAGPGVRVDSGVDEGTVVTPYYDSLLAKVVATGSSREEATQRMLRALGEFEIEGVGTLIPLHRQYLASQQWAAAVPSADLALGAVVAPAQER